MNMKQHFMLKFQTLQFPFIVFFTFISLIRTHNIYKKCVPSETYTWTIAGSVFNAPHV